MEIRYDRYSLILDGKRTFIRSGAMHYFRLPGQGLWRDRLFKLRAAGYNTVDLYFCWAYHSPEPGIYNFDGIRDVRRLLQIAEELDFHVIARPGPYINAEYTAGGLPGWLLARRDVVLRNRTPDGAFQWSEPYMDAVREWWGEILPIITDCPRVILMQIENEYATQEVEPDYIRALYEMARSMGISVPLFHNDLYAAGLYEDIVDIYAFDNYSVTSFETNWRHLSGIFSVLDNVEVNFRPFCENRPLFVAELQAGWFGTWKGYAYEHIIDHLGREHIGLTTKSLIGQGLTLFNHYKAIGGTNWGTIGSTDTYTSYDFGAPINEAGVNTERLWETKAINQFLESFDLAATDRVDNPDVTLSKPEHLYAVRRNTLRPEETWVFLRNLSGNPVDTTLDGDLPVHLGPHECLILPCNIRLASGPTLVRASIEPLYQSDSLLVLKGNRAARIELRTGTAELELLHGTLTVDRDAACGLVALSSQQLAANDFAAVKIGPVTVYLLGQYLADRLWVERDGRLIAGPDARLPDGYGVSITGGPWLAVEPGGSFETRLLDPALAPDLPKLETWHSENLAPELTINRALLRVSNEGADFDNNGFYEGSAWYRYSLEGRPSSLTIDARHIWAAFLNGVFIGEGHHMVLIHGEVPVAPTTLAIAPHLLKDGQPNELVIFVDGLGHPKGFHDDARTPQGLLLLKVDDREVTRDVCYSVGFSTYPPTGPVPGTSPLVRITTEFTLALPENVHCPLGIEIKNLDYERINLYLNDVLIGRHWRKCQAQNRYYLPESILHVGNGKKNVLGLVLMNFNPMISLNQCFPTSEQVALRPYGVFTKIHP